MKINDTMSPTVVAYAMPKGDNFLTDISAGITSFYDNKDKRAKNKISIDAAQAELNDRKSLADFMQKGGDPKEYNFQTGEAAEKANKYWDAKREKQTELEDVSLIGKYLNPSTTDEERAAITFNSPKTYKDIYDIEYKKQKPINDKIKTGAYVENIFSQINKRDSDAKNNAEKSNAMVKNYKNQIENRDAGTEIKKQKLENSAKKTDTPKQQLQNFKAEDELTKLKNEKAVEDLRSEWGDIFDKLDEKDQQYAIEHFKQTGKAPRIANDNGLFGTGLLKNYYLPDNEGEPQQEQSEEDPQPKKKEEEDQTIYQEDIDAVLSKYGLGE